MIKIKEKWLSLAEKIKNTFARKILGKYQPAAVPYYDSAYMVLLAVGKKQRGEIVPLYARSQYINYQVKQYAAKEIIREIRVETRPVDGISIFQTYNPARFFESMNVSTKREWGKIFYTFSKEYETFYRQQYHKGPELESEVGETGLVVKKEVREEEEFHIRAGVIYQETETRYREQETHVKELAEKVENCIQRIARQEETVKKQILMQSDRQPAQIDVNISKITSEVMENLRRHLELERMRHGY